MAALAKQPYFIIVTSLTLILMYWSSVSSGTVTCYKCKGLQCLEKPKKWDKCTGDNSFVRKRRVSRDPPSDQSQDDADNDLHPYIRPTNQNLTVFPGERAALRCRVENLGTKMVIWRKKGEVHPLTIGKHPIAAEPRLSVENNPRTSEWTLVIQDVRPSDEGLYHCQINTENDSENSFSVQLNVRKIEEKTTDKHKTTKFSTMLLSTSKATTKHTTKPTTTYTTKPTTTKPIWKPISTHKTTLANLGSPSHFKTTKHGDHDKDYDERGCVHKLVEHKSDCHDKPCICESNYCNKQIISTLPNLVLLALTTVVALFMNGCKAP